MRSRRPFRCATPHYFVELPRAVGTRFATPLGYLTTGQHILAKLTEAAGTQLNSPQHFADGQQTSTDPSRTAEAPSRMKYIAPNMLRIGNKHPWVYSTNLDGWILRMPTSDSYMSKGVRCISVPRPTSRSSTSSLHINLDIDTKIPTPQKPMPSNLGSSPSTPPAKRQKTSESPVIMRRNQQVRNLAEQRDKSCCALTGDFSIGVYPYHSIKRKEEGVFGQRHILRDHLKNFWSKEKVAT
ncbi:hypothetical protein BJ875DRAFT_443105 [Amylocarpus encephaloides]|uniref:Uncharacterized protein n=1 Tax=Amylocarpus encephaloides TaxID=45428 RepID=A0A9P7YEN1_9HELO|nr:hypothetical protein BJ875DRAFT_443105 [Amylocarpus encephaloides]